MYEICLHAKSIHILTKSKVSKKKSQSLPAYVFIEKEIQYVYLKTTTYNKHVCCKQYLSLNERIHYFANTSYLCEMYPIIY